MKKHTTALVIVLLFAVSAIIYSVQITVFHDQRDTLFYFLQDWAFLPVQIAVVTIVVGKIIGAREKRERLSKIKMLASSFFCDLGTDLLHEMLGCVNNVDTIAPSLCVHNDWKSRDFAGAADTLRTAALNVQCTADDLARMRSLLLEKRLSMLVIASNPVLLEHEDFTDMLWAIFHLTDELTARTAFESLPQSEAEHLNTDVKRALLAILVNWMRHMEHIRAEYPYLFALAVRQNPLGAHMSREACALHTH
ncbi:MAG: hypothetical protein EOM63_07790 [Clostridia bacterium]|nr:hypothetical protein [Clostridia bacterium]